MQQAKQASLEYQEPVSSEAIFILSLVLVVLTLSCTWLNVQCTMRNSPQINQEQANQQQRSTRSFIITFGGMVLLQVIITCLLITCCIHRLQQISQHLKTLDNMTYINDCGDDYTNLYGHELYHDIRSSEMRQKSLTYFSCCVLFTQVILLIGGLTSIRK